MKGVRDEKRVRSMIYESQAIITDSHLVLTSGKHSTCYIDFRVLAGCTDGLDGVGGMIADAILEHQIEVHNRLFDIRSIVIVGPETLGRTLAEFTAIRGSFVKFAWCGMSNNEGGNDIAIWNLKLNFENAIRGARCYIVDDVLTTAKSLKLVVKLIESTGGYVAGAVVVVRRDQNVTAETAGIPWLHVLIDFEGFETYEPDQCPMCVAKVPMRLRPGYGYEWSKENPDYPTE